MGYLTQGWDIAQTWVMSPAAWSQFALLIVAYLLAWGLTRALRPLVTRMLSPSADNQSIFAKFRRFVLIFVPLLLPLLAYVFSGVGANVTRSLFGAGDVIGFGQRVFLFLAARSLVRDILKDPFLRLLGRYVLLPVAALYAMGQLGVVTEALQKPPSCRWATCRSTCCGCCRGLRRRRDLLVRVAGRTTSSSSYIAVAGGNAPRHAATGRQGRRDRDFRRGFPGADEHHGHHADLLAVLGGRHRCRPWLWPAKDRVQLSFRA